MSVTARCLRAVILVVCAGTGITAVPGVSAQETIRLSWTPDPYGLAGAASLPLDISQSDETDLFPTITAPIGQTIEILPCFCFAFS